MYFLLLLPKFSEIGPDFLGIKHYSVALFFSKGHKLEIDDEKPYVTLPLLAALLTLLAPGGGQNIPPWQTYFSGGSGHLDTAFKFDKFS